MNIESLFVSSKLEGKIQYGQNIEIILCTKCRTYIKHDVLTDIYHTGDEYDGILTMFYNHRILGCTKYNALSYQDKIANSEQVDQSGEEYDGTPIHAANAQLQIYPLRHDEPAFSKEFEKILPEELYLTYEQVIIALNNNM